MGCALVKHPMSSPPPGLQKLKMETGYVSREGNIGARRSVGQRLFRPELRISRGDHGGSGCSGGKDGKVQRDSSGTGVGGGNGGDDGSGGNVSRRISLPKLSSEDELVDGWPKWLTDNIPKDVLAGLVPKSAGCYDKLDKVGQGTYSNVYKARERSTGKIVALKKVRFDTSEPESVKFMAREIMFLRKLDHPNIIKLEGLATSRMQYSLYLVFDYMRSDLARVIARPDELLTEPQVKCYMQQLLSGLQHCHERGILHRDIKGSNLLIDKNGVLKIADFGLANYFDLDKKRPLTSRVVTLWYRAPELLLGATEYGVGIDLWSAGCLMAEMFTGRAIMPGRTEVEQLHRIFKLCGTPSEEYWRKLKVPTTLRPTHAYRPSIQEAFKDFPASSFGLLCTLLALDPAYRGSAGTALQNEFFHTSPLACDLSGLPKIGREYDELTQVNEKRKQRNAKMRRRSQTQKELLKKDLATEKPREDSGSVKEEPKKNAGLTVHSQELGSRTTSTHSSIKPSRQEESAPPSLCPSVSSGQKMSPTTDAKANATNHTNTLPPRVTKTNNINYFINNDSDYIYRLHPIRRSISTREFQNLDQKKHLELQAFDDYVT